MNATPRRGAGAFPATPATRARGGGASPSSASSPLSGNGKPLAKSNPSSQRPSKLPNAPESSSLQSSSSRPLIPTTILDAPTQRFYAAAAYIAILAWRLYDWAQLVEDNSESLWLFLKWEIIDCLFFFGLPELRIPWLEPEQTVIVSLFVAHAIINFVLMFRIPIPFLSWLAAFVKVFYDREVSISDRYVKVSSIVHNSSLIMGRQIINILPEGSAVLNPDAISYCLGGDHTTVSIPLYLNATNPIEIELIRTDLFTNKEEVLRFGSKKMRDIQRRVKRQTADPDDPLVRVEHAIKKTGVYRLGKVLDQYKLEVQRPNQPTYVVSCPKARVMAVSSAKRCLGDLSDVILEVEGTPPLMINYSRSINGKDYSFHFQSLQPEGFSSPLVGSARTSAVILPENEDVSWARPQQVSVNLNESMSLSGDWQYSIEAVHDVFENVVRYVTPVDEVDVRPKAGHLMQAFKVQERPRASFHGCDAWSPLKIARGDSATFPIKVGLGDMGQDTTFEAEWQFSPVESLTKNGDHGNDVSYRKHTASKTKGWPRISAPGLYTLKSISANACEGTVQEPASCLLLNPLEPSLQVQSEEISDQCAGQSTGLRVDFDFVGSPPFIAYYFEDFEGRRTRHKFTANGVRAQLDLMPPKAGTHKYVFTGVSDAIYGEQSLTGSNMVLETTVKPQSSANIIKPTGSMSVCLDDEVEVEVALHGEPPFTLEWELVHNGKRKAHKIPNINERVHNIKTSSLSQGGDYMVTLTAIKDKSGCRNFLKDELRITARRQRPRGAFGLIDGKSRIVTIDDDSAKIPLRLNGLSPWTVTYRRAGEESSPITRVFQNENDVLEVRQSGTYELVSLSDKQCPGSVDEKASRFNVDWYPRPQLSITESDSMTTRDGKYIKQDVCEGDIDGFQIDITGSPPYHMTYDVRQKPAVGSASISRREVNVASGKASIQMEASKAGLNTYTFTSLTDYLYDNDKDGSHLIVEQRVNANPSVTFIKPGQTFKMCMAENEDSEKIPIRLTGVAPFYLEIEIQHQSGTVPETYRITSIETNLFNIEIPRRYLKLGSQQVRIRKVRDARGCQSKTQTGGPSVQVQLSDAPAIYPLETRADYCVGERIAYTLSGTPPFEIWYTFDGASRKAKSSSTSFRRIAEAPGAFTLTSISDRASDCTASFNITKTIHPMPSVRISQGKQVQVDIHEGSEVEMLFEFGGTPPFEFTYTRSANAKRGGQKGVVLETRHDISYEHSKTIRVNQEGTYEVVAIKDRFCAFSTQSVGSGEAQRLLQ